MVKMTMRENYSRRWISLTENVISELSLLRSMALEVLRTIDRVRGGIA
jgi:hypothetical protein